MSARLILLVIAVVLALPGCDSSPTQIEGGDQLLEGMVAFDGTSRHDVVITKEGGVRFEVESIVADPPLPEGINESLGFGLGEPDSEDDCDFSFQGTITAFSNLAFGLQQRVYCIVLFDNGTFPEDSTRSYSILVRASD